MFKIIRLSILIVAVAVLGSASVGFWVNVYGEAGNSGGAGSGSPQAVGVGVRAEVQAVFKLTINCANSVTGSAADPPAGFLAAASLAHDFGFVTATVEETTSGGGTAYDEENQDTATTAFSAVNQVAFYGLSCTLTSLAAGSAFTSGTFVLEAKSSTGATANIVLFKAADFVTGTSFDYDTIANKEALTDAYANLDTGSGSDILTTSPGIGSKTNSIDLTVAIPDNMSTGAKTAVVSFNFSHTP